MQKRSSFDYLVVALKGMAMGAADVVPGVSGGTIAFISGIYEELIDSINSINLDAFRTLLKKGIAPAWKQINGNFLFSLILGILISFFTLMRFVKWMLENYPILLWAFFFGLVLASIFFVGKQIKKWTVGAIVSFLGGAFIAYYITTLPPLAASSNSFFLFLAGALAICAMILPGISGAFILVLLGAYQTVSEATHDFDFKTLAVLAGGAVFGLLSFSRILKWLFRHYENITLALLTGFILGSLNKIWPWKEVLESQLIGDKEIVIKEQSISPFAFEGDNYFTMAVVLAITGFLTIFILEKISTQKH